MKKYLYIVLVLFISSCSSKDMYTIYNDDIPGGVEYNDPGTRWK